MMIDLYLYLASPPCTTVRLVAAALDLDLNIIDLKVAGEQHKTEFLKVKIKIHLVTPALINVFKPINDYHDRVFRTTLCKDLRSLFKVIFYYECRSQEDALC